MATTQTEEIKMLHNAIHCGSCETRIKTTAERIPGVERVEASHHTQMVTVQFDPEAVSISDIRQQLDDLGYESESPE